MSKTPIGDHGLLSDCGAAALVTSCGSVDWLCLPRFDSPPVFARLLDPGAGHFQVGPTTGAMATNRRYLPSGLVLELTWDTSDGMLTLTDALALGSRERGHQLGRSSPGVLLRRVRCERGSVAVRIDYAPRPEFGLVHPRLSATPGAVVARGGATVVVLSTDIDLQIEAATAGTTVTLDRGDEISFALTETSAWEPPPAAWNAHKIRRRLRSTETSWRSWSELHQRYEGPHCALVHHSGVVLQGLTYARTGAVVAAATTSLPEGAGTARTWDYRYTWVRDASMTLEGLWIAACPDEAGRFFAFLATAAATQLDRGVNLQIMFGVAGERDLSERTLTHLTGWRDSRPVRAGNDAWKQRQLDVYGALVGAAHTLQDQLGDLDDATRDFLVAAVDAAASRWTDDDQGIWEVRGPPRPYLHSKLMCWVATDRGLAMRHLLRPDAGRAARWTAARDDIRAAILDRGWSEVLGAFAQALDSDQLDASVLLLATTGFLPPDDRRLHATIDAVERHLSDQRGLIYRYRGADGLDGDEGTFLLCTFWLAHALAVTGQPVRARIVLDRAAAHANDLGLFAEQVDPATGELLGNYPQAFSHLGLVTAAHALADAEHAAAARLDGRPPGPGPLRGLA